MSWPEITRRTGWIAFSFLLLCSPAAAAQNHEPAGLNTRQQKIFRLFREAAQDVKARQYPAAIEKYKSVLALQPDSPEALNNLGIVYHLAGQYPEAVETLEKARKLNPNLLPASLILGIDYVRVGRLRDALAPLKKVLDREPANRDALLAMASAYFGMKDFYAAANLYLEEVGHRSDDAKAWYGAGLCFEHLAEGTTRKLHSIASDSTYYNRLLGEVLSDQGEQIQAEEAFRRALAKAGNDNEGLHAALGFSHLRLGMVKEADAQFQKEIQLHPGALEGEFGLAGVALTKADYPVALDTLCKVQRADEDFFLNRLPFLVASLNQKVQDETESFLRQGTPKTCPEVAETLRKEIAAPGTIVGFQRAFEESPPASAATTSPKGLKAGARKSRMACSDVSGPLSKLSMGGVLRRARCASDSGQYLLSLRAAEFASKREPDNVEVLYWRAEATRKLAQASFEKAVQLDPDSWQGNILVGDIYRQRGKYTLAIQHYEAAAKTNPGVPASYLGLATSYWQTGKFDEAVAAAQKVLQLDPHNTQAKFELGDIHVRRHEFNEAVPYLQAVIAARPENLIAHGDLGKAWAGLGKVDEAIRELTIAMPTDEQGDLHYQLFLLYKKQGKKDLAQQALATSKQLRERSAQLRATRLARAFKAAHAEPQDEKQEAPAH